jgi:glyoxylase-like metal-dependent hydrolase (beta-lactamase superfamily II)
MSSFVRRVAVMVFQTACVPWALNPTPPPPISMEPQAALVTATIGGAPVRVHAIPSGTIAVKNCHRSNCLDESANYRERFFSILEDEAFAEPMPIWSYVIEHPEGAFAIDTGETPAFSDARAWSCDERAGQLSQAILKIEVDATQTLAAQVSGRGLSPGAFKAVVLTHAHADHVGGIPDFAGVPIWTTRADFEAGTNFGIIPCRTTRGAMLRYLDDAIAATPPVSSAEDAQLGPGLAMTRDGSLRAWMTPGHTPGSVVLRLTTDQGVLWFVGDLTFTASELGETLAGIHGDFEGVKKTTAAIQALASAPKSLILASHDPGVPALLSGWRAGSP